MQTKRSRRNIWKLIDSIMLLLPILYILYGFICYLVQFSSYKVDTFALLDFVDIFEEIRNAFEFILYNPHGFFGAIFENSDTNALLDFIYNFTKNIFGFFGVDITTNLSLVFVGYFLSYSIIYEFLSLFIQIILWLPRWARNKFNESGD